MRHHSYCTLRKGSFTVTKIQNEYTSLTVNLLVKTEGTKIPCSSLEGRTPPLHPCLYYLSVCFTECCINQVSLVYLQQTAPQTYYF